MKTILYIIPACLLFASLFWSCEKEEGDFIGPDFAVASDDFKFKQDFSASPSTVDFSADSVRFSADFNEHVNWEIKIRGLQSQAVHSVTGQSKTLEPAKVFWKGITDTIRLFRQEKCVATLHISGLEEVQRDTIEILDTYEYGKIIRDTENPTGGWFVGPDGSEPFNVDINADVVPPEGDKSILLSGEDLNGNFFIGTYGPNTGNMPDRGTGNPDSLWINLFVYGQGGDTNAKIEIKFEENDGDTYFHKIVPDHTGWELVSYKYSIMNTYPNQTGNLVHEPDSLTGMGFLLGSEPEGNAVEVRIDYPIFTTGGPLLEQ